VTTTFASIYRYLVPSWIVGGDGAALLDAYASMLDGANARLRAGLMARFPTSATDESLALLGLDRGLRRGRSESADGYARRLIRWRSGHLTRGGAFALLDQVLAYLGGDAAAWTIDSHGTRYDAPAGTVTRGEVSYVNSGDPVFWVGIEPGTTITRAPEWGASLWGGSVDPGSAYCIGLVGLSPDDTEAIRALMHPPHAWCPAGVYPEWVVVHLDGSLPSSRWRMISFLTGAWASWSRDYSGSRITTRPLGWAMWSLDPERNNAYDGVWPEPAWSDEVPLAGYYCGTPGDGYSGSVGASSVPAETPILAALNAGGWWYEATVTVGAPTTYSAVILYATDASTSAEVLVYWNASVGRLRIKDAAGTTSTIYSIRPDGVSGTWPAGTYRLRVHVAGAGRVRAWVDGYLSVDSTFAGTLPTELDTLRAPESIGSGTFALHSAHAGALDAGDGDDAVWTAITLPDGSTYAGTATWDTDPIQLLDDGDHT
jgi:hypothetical protein